MVLVIIFREVSAHANETREGKGCDIAMAHCRSFPGFQMMELSSGRISQFESSCKMESRIEK